MARESSEYSDVVALIFDPAMERIAVRSDRRSEPPRFRAPLRFYPEVREVLDAMRRETGADCIILRCLDVGDAERGRPRVYSALADSGELRAPFRWVSQSDIRLPAGVSLDEPPDAPRPQAWQREPGWRREVAGWIADNLPDSVRGAGWSLSQIRSWAISAVFRVESDGARLYFKASPSYFGTEAALTARVAREFPDVSPRVVAADAARGWLLMEDLGDDTLSTAPSARVWRDAMGALARVQIAYAGDRAALGELRDMGIERRSPAAALETLRTWVADPDAAGVRVWRERLTESLRRLEPRLDRLDDMRRRLDALALPDTLDHGDLDSTNIFVQNARPILMDWSDAAISNPLFTAAMIAPVSRDPDLADAFLSRWTPFAALDDLRRGFAISKTLAAIDRAAHYSANIVPHLPPNSAELRDLERYVPDLLDMAASALAR